MVTDTIWGKLAKRFFVRNRHFFLLDIMILLATPFIALILRLDTVNLPASFLPGLVAYALGALVVRQVIFYYFGLYRRFWQYASIEELVQIAAAVFTATVVVIGLYLLVSLVVTFQFARSVLLIDALLVLLLVGGLRFSLRLAHMRRPVFPQTGTRRVLIIGAGDSGSMVVRELQKHPHRGLRPVAFLDDDAMKHHMVIHGLPVLGSRERLLQTVAQQEIDEVIIAMPTAPGKVVRQVRAQCEQANVSVKTVPAMHDLLSGQVHVSQLRDIDIEDLLRRDPVQTDRAAVQALLAGKRVLVTGGGGSIGSELCRQILQCAPAELILLGHGENSIFEIYHQLRLIQQRQGLAATQITPLIADIRFSDRINALFAQYRPQIVFHAAAHKHVPLMEQNPAEAVTNNIQGTRNVLAAAAAVNVQRFVMISTDKAVNPTNVMGATKRAAELSVIEKARQTGGAFVAVRFGNVLGSRGSVVLTFKRQIAAGGPVTVTHPDITRYFMTIPEAVTLVLQAAVLGKGGEIFTLDMGEPIKIVDMARDMIELSGLEVGRDIDIEFVGLRPGEKLFEELFLDSESYRRTAHEKIFIAENGNLHLPPDLTEQVAALTAVAQQQDNAAILAGLQRLVPTYAPQAAPPQKVEARNQGAAPTAEKRAAAKLAAV